MKQKTTFENYIRTCFLTEYISGGTLRQALKNKVRAEITAVEFV